MGSLLTDDYLAYIRADVTVLGAGNEWDDQVPIPYTWNAVNADTETWLQLFTLTAAPNVSMKIKYGPTNPPTNEVSRMEIVSAVLNNFQYLQVEITITDPSEGITALVEEFDLVLRRPT
ncbi:MAG: hypothetical protein ACXABY_34660 [Candidatus Thorarchaeota archaeon]|jgi:hypothetical protein